jgi:glucosyl-dolichyl phosphate glucuronosyltransferase
MLAKTLDQMTRLTVPAGVTWELLIVNNSSTDATDEVIASFEGRLPVRSTWEAAPGLSSARNRALAEATGEYILWTDDDVFVDDGWLGGYVQAFRRWPDADVFGGPIEPLFEGKPPNWILRLLDRIGHVYGRQTFGNQPVALCAESTSDGPYGGNMAMRREVLLRFPFDPNLGVRHGVYGIGEETEVIRRMLAAGHTGWWTPEARVRHWVPRSSQTLGYVRRWMVGCGKQIAQSQERDHRRHRLLARLIRHEITFQLRRHFAPPEVWIENLTRASQARGRLLASRALKPKEEAA